MSRVLLLPLVLVLAACAREPRVVPIVGPDGSRMFHVSCGDREGECYRLAGERCPHGYDVGGTIAGAGNMLVRCRAPMMESAYPAAQYPVAPAATAPVYAPVATASPSAAPAAPPAAPSASSGVVRTPAVRSTGPVPPRVDLGY